MPSAKTLVDREVLQRRQQCSKGQRPDGLTLSEEKPQLWQNQEGKVWVPDEDTELQTWLYALAHQGISGHRGAKVTLALLQQEVFWGSMEEDVGKWRSRCLQCIKQANGDIVPRPLGSQLVAERPGEILMLDYIKLGPNRTGLYGALMMVDRFARFAWFVPAAVSLFQLYFDLKTMLHYKYPKSSLTDGNAVMSFEHVNWFFWISDIHVRSSTAAVCC